MEGMKSFFYVALAVAVILGGIILFTHPSDGERKTVSPGALMRADDWIRGDLGAPLQIVEYTDFQCPACAAYHPILKELKTRFGDDLAIAYRHFPLVQHAHADDAARAAEAAGRQGKFFEMHDILFENQNAWAKENNPRALFVSYAASLGIDMAQFDADLDLTEIDAKVEAQRRSGVALRANGTPTFFLNGERMKNPEGLEAFMAALAEKLTEKAEKIQQEIESAAQQ